MENADSVLRGKRKQEHVKKDGKMKKKKIDQMDVDGNGAAVLKQLEREYLTSGSIG